MKTDRDFVVGQMWLLLTAKIEARSIGTRTDAGETSRDFWKTKESGSKARATGWSLHPRHPSAERWTREFAGPAERSQTAADAFFCCRRRADSAEVESPMTSAFTQPQITPVRLDLKRDEKLEIQWQDGKVCIYTLSLLRSRCPCAQCKTIRQESEIKKPLLQILPGNYSAPLSALSGELIGNYAIKIEWSDGHGSGIYSFQFLREICP
jgi:DUF971 family protein